MNARYDKFTLKQKKTMREAVAEEFNKQSSEVTLRVFKLFCVVLNEKFGFGKDRLNKLMQGVTELGDARSQDEIFWAHIDRILNEQTGLDFPEEDYDKMDD